MEGVGDIEIETDTGLRFVVHGVVTRRDGIRVRWGRCIDDVPTGKTFGSTTLGTYCANVVRGT